MIPTEQMQIGPPHADDVQPSLLFMLLDAIACPVDQVVENFLGRTFPSAQKYTV